MHPWLNAAGEATDILVHVQPGARRSAVVGLHGDALKVAVREKATEGEANKAVCDLLARTLGVAPSSIRVVRGHRSRRKRIRVEGVGVDSVDEAITPLLTD